MAEPFGIVAVSITALKVAQGLHGLIIKWREAPQELLALSNEACNLKFVLDAVQAAVREDGENGLHQRQKVEPMLLQARIKLDSLDSLVARWGNLSAWGDSFQMSKRDQAMWLKERNKTWELQKGLRDIRFGLSVLLDAGTASQISRLTVDIQNLYAETARSSSEHSETLAEGLEALEIISRQVSPIEEIRRNSDTSVELLQTICRTVTKTTAEREPSPEPKNLQSIINSGRTTRSPDSEDPKPSYFAVPVSSQRVKAASCSLDCRCLCHARHNTQAFPTLDRIIGRLFLGYHGWSALRQSCDLSTCRQRNATSARLSYFFPRWFLNKAVSATFASDTFGTPDFNLKFRKSVSETNRLFALSRCEGVDGIQELFTNRLASPDDIDHRGGWTSLHFSIDHGCIEVTKLLLQEGADPNWEDNTGTTPAEIAWRNILHLKTPPALAEAFSVLFSKADYCQGRRFSHLHKIIIGLEPGDLRAELDSKATPLINDRDLDGWTPLHWAARRGNSNAVELLLTHGADPLLKTFNEGRGPLHLAAMSNSALCLQQLLSWRRANSVLDLELRDDYGCTPLRVAAQYNAPAATALLIKYGADLNAPEHFGDTPLLTAVGENNVETAALLLRAGADYTAATAFGNHVLHLAANIADVPMLVVLAKARLRGLDLAKRNSDGHTAREKVALRPEAPEAFPRAFDRLVRSITDENYDPGSWATSPTGTEQSWHSFDDAGWYEAEAAAIVEADAAEREAEDVGKEAEAGIASISLDEKKGWAEEREPKDLGTSVHDYGLEVSPV